VLCLPYMRRQDRATPKRLCVMILSISLMPTAPSRSAETDGTFAAVALSKTSAADVAPLLERALSLQGERAEIVVDAQRNQILVRGSSAAQRRIRELVKTFDQPTSPDRSRGNPGAVRANLPARPAENVRASFSENARPQPPPHIKKPANAAPPRKTAKQPAKNAQRKGQAVDQTPWPYHEVQKLVARPADSAVETVVETIAIPLKHLPAEELPSRLKKLLANRLSPLATTTEGVTSYIVQLPGHTPLEIHIDKEAGRAVIRGPAESARHGARLIEAIDAEPVAAAHRTRVVPLHAASSPYVRQALDAVATSSGDRTQRAASNRLVARLFQPRRAAQVAAQQADDQAETQPVQPPQGDEAMPDEEEDEHGALSGDVEIEQIPDLGAIIVRGSQRDVERVMKIIEEIERLSAETEPVIELYPLKHIASEAMSDVVKTLYDDELAPRQGRVSITPLVHPNALLLIGRAESVKSAKDLISRLDQPGDPTSQFEVFRLRYATAATAATTLNSTFGTFGTGLGVRLRVTADARTNSLIVQAGPRDLLEVRKLLKQLDVAGSAAVNELRLFRLRYASAVEVAAVLNAAVQRMPQTGQAGAPQQQQGGQPQQFGQGGQFQQQQQQPQQQPGGQQAQPGQGQGQQAAGQETKTVMLRFMTIDTEGKRQLSVGHLGDIRISADAKTNTVVISAPADSLDLIAAVIAQLDLPNAVPAQIKVFELKNGDATNMVTMLEDLFQISGNSVVAGGAQAQQQQITAEEGAAVPLRFSVDARTNSIIASGSASDLTVVEAILLRLDDSGVRERQNVVYKLKNAPALDVSIALNEYLQKERQTQQTSPGLLSPFEKIEREVVVVPELVTNSLIVSATPRFFDEIAKIVEQLDARAPMVMIQVLIAEVTLTNTDEFGIELGLQNSVMFDRSLLSGFQLLQTSNNIQNPGGGVVTVQNQQIVGANSTPGFDFNNPTLIGAVPPPNSTISQAPFAIGLPNSGSAESLGTAGLLGQQALSNFGMGRTNSTLGYGGLVLSLSSDTVNFLLRALRERDRLDVLSRPQIMTLDNQPAYIVVGQRVPLLQGSTVGITGATTGVQYTPVGLIIAVTPRITPDGLVVMEIDAEKSVLGPVSSGIPVGFGALGQVLRQPVINLTQAQTTISALDGQTVVFGGMITQSSQVIQRRVPGLSEIPLLGRLFRYDYQNGNKTELLIIMTPHVIRNQADAERLKRFEAGRISWCLSDVVKLHGEAGLRNRHDEWRDNEIPTIYPDMDPTGAAAEGPEPLPTPTGQPAQPRMAPPRLQYPGQAPPAGPPMSKTAPVKSTGPRPPQIASRNQLRLRGPAPAPTPAPQMQTAAMPPANAPTPVVSHRRQPPPPGVQQLQFESPPAGGQQ
jgi:general secretion pathway protein D